MASLKPKVANVVNDQLPSYIADNYDNFVTFLEKYYDWLETNGNPLEFVRNIVENHDYDTADEVYKTLLDKGVLNGLPTDIGVDKSLLVKNIKKIYRTKGTEDSFQFLLNALFSENAELGRPEMKWGKDYYQKVSDSVLKSESVICIRQPQLEAVSRIHQGKVVEVRLTQSDIGFTEAPSVSFMRNDTSIDGIPVIDYSLSGYITKANVINGGVGYTTANVTVVGDCSVSAVMSAIIVDGAITGFSITNYGSGYKENPTMVITGDGFGATGEFEWTAVLGSVTIIEPGVGWSSPPRLEFIGGLGTKTITVGDSTEVVPCSPARVSFSLTTDGGISSPVIDFVGENYEYKPTMKWVLQPNKDALGTAILSGNKITSVKIEDSGTNYKIAPAVVFQNINYDYNVLVGQRIIQLGENYATGIVDSVVNYEINGETYFILSLQKEGLKGVFTYDSVIQTEDSKIVTVTTPIFSSVDTVNAGSGYKRGDYINFIGTGLGGRLSVDEVSDGGVDKCIITKSGHSYAVGDKITQSGDSLGTDFEAEVSSIDGIGAIATAVMELDEIKIVDNGYGYQVGDEILVYAGADYNTDTKYKLAQLVVTSLLASDDLKSLTVLSGGSGYQYVSLAILPSAGSFSPLRQIRPDGTSYKNGVSETTRSTLSKTITSGVIKSLDVNLTDVDLNDSSVSTIINGQGALLHINNVSSTRITEVLVDSSGINYVDPIVKITSGVGKGASFRVNKNEFGAITSVDVLNGGSGYTVADDISIVERYGVGAIIQTNLRTNGIGAFDVKYAGEFRNFNKESATPYKLFGGSGKELVLDLYYRPKYIDIDDQGKYYTEYNLDFSEGHGTGAQLKVNVENDVIKSFTITNGGTGYTWARVYINSSLGYGFEGKAVLTAGVITAIQVIDGGHGYDPLDPVIIYGDGSGYNVSINTVADGVIKSIEVIEGGSNYHYDCDITVSSTGTPTEATLSPVFESGVLKSITVVNGGSGYSPLSTAAVTYLEHSTDTDPNHVIRGIGKYTNSVVDPLGTTTVSYNGISVSNITSPIWPLSGGGLVNTMFQVVDFVDLWPQTVAYPREATYNLESEIFGAISDISLLNEGTGYFADWEREPLYLTVNGVGSGAQLEPILKDGNFIDVLILDGGEDYVQLSTSVTITGGHITGTNAVLTPVVSDGVIIRVDIDNPGTGYYYGTSVSISGDGEYGRARAIVETGITSVDILNGGSNYSDLSLSLAVIDSNPPNTIPGSGAIIKAILSASGSIIDVIILDKGKGYYNPQIIITHGVGSNAVINCYAKRPITKIVIENAGKNYTNADVRIVGDGVLADAECKVSSASLKSIDVTYKGNRYSKYPIITVFDSSNYGAISGVKIKSAGRGYKEFPLLDIDTINGKSAEIVSFSNSIGKIKKINFNEFSFGSYDIPMLQYPLKAIVPENTAYTKNELVYVKGYNYPNNDYTQGPHARVRHIDYDRNLVSFYDATDNFEFVTEDSNIAIECESTNKSISGLTLSHEYSFEINLGDILVGSQSKSEGKLLEFNRGNGYANLNGYGHYPISVIDSQSSMSNKRFKMANNKKYQDFSYVIKTGLMFKDYASYIDKLLHIAGYSAWGEVDITTQLETKIQLPVNEKTGQAIYDIIVLYFSIAPALYNVKFHNQLWRLNNYRINESVFYYDYPSWRLGSKELKSLALNTATIADINGVLSNGFETNITWPSESYFVEAIGDSIYEVISNVATVTHTNHGLNVGDKIWLTKETGNGMSGYYYISTSSTNSFTVQMAIADTTGDCVISKYISRLHANSVVKPWKVGQYYETNDVVEIDHNKLYLAKTGHTSTSNNSPLGGSSNWFVWENAKSSTYPI